MSYMEDIDSTLMNMSKEDLKIQLLNLKNQYIFNLKQFDHDEQQFYEMKRQLSISRTRKEHISLEFESLQSADLSNTDNLMKKIEVYEKELLFVKQANFENIMAYKSQLHETDDNIRTLEENINSGNNASDNMEKMDQFTDIIFEFKSKCEQLTDAINSNDLKYTEAKHKNELLKSTLAEWSNNILQLKDCLNSEREKLEENDDLVHNLQEEIIVLQMELQKFKGTSLDKVAKTNSLFAEVDDGRLKLKEQAQISNKKYINIKLEYNNRSQELQKLHSEYASLTKIKENKNNLQDAQYQLTEAYKRHFNNLTEIMKNTEKEFELRNLTNNKIMSNEIDCIEELFPITQREIKNLQKEINAESLARIMSEQSLCDTKREIKKWQIEVSQLHAKEVMLNQMIEDLKIMKNPLQNNDSTDNGSVFVKEEMHEYFNDYNDENLLIEEPTTKQENTKIIPL